MEYRTSIARARGLGASHHGSRHWWRQRITALALLPSGLWFVLCLAHLPDAEFETVRAWLQNPVNGVVALTFTVVSFYHAGLGLQVIIEDYIHAKWLKRSIIIAIKSLLTVSGLVAGFAMLYVMFGV